MKSQQNSSDFDRVILVDKPAGISSFGVVSRIRGKLSREKRFFELTEFREKNPVFNSELTEENIAEFAKNPHLIPKEIHEKISLTKKIKVGHAGTLDPFATGLLIVLTGKMTREQDKFMRHDKTYSAKIRLGETSTTGDPEGEISRILTNEQAENFAKNLKNEEIAKMLAEKFTGEITQVPPVFSAIKMDGVKAYEISRKAAKIREKSSENRENLSEKERKILAKNDEFREKFATEKSRKIVVKNLEIVNFQWPILEIRAEVSAGTYIRTLAEDIGAALGTGAFCAELRREKIGEFDVENAVMMNNFTSKIRDFSET